MRCVKCLLCGDVLSLDTNYKLLWCSCSSVGVDGGKDYYRILGFKENYDVVEEKEIGTKRSAKSVKKGRR